MSKIKLFVFELCSRLAKLQDLRTNIVHDSYSIVIECKESMRKQGYQRKRNVRSLRLIGLRPNPEFNAFKIVLNYYDWEEPLIQSKKCYDVIRKHGKQVIVMEPVNGGMLAKVPAGAGQISAYDRAFETGDYTAQTEKIGGAFDVTAAVREAATYHAENNYQTYMD